MIRCQNCGQGNSNGSNFCRFCGVKFSHMLPKKPNRQQPTQPVNRQQPPPVHRQSPPLQRQPERPQPPPVRRPYSWKTDEFQVKDTSAKKTQRINQVRPLADIPSQQNQQITHQRQSQPPQYHQHQQRLNSYGYRCPRCATQLMPVSSRKISSAGWVTFAILLVTFFPLFWIGLLIKENVQTCPICNVRVG